MKAGVKIIDRYIGRELFTSMSLGLGFFTFVLLTKSIPKLIELVLSKGVPLGSAARLLLHMLPPPPGLHHPHGSSPGGHRHVRPTGR